MKKKINLEQLASEEPLDNKLKSLGFLKEDIIIEFLCDHIRKLNKEVEQVKKQLTIVLDKI